MRTHMIVGTSSCSSSSNLPDVSDHVSFSIEFSEQQNMTIATIKSESFPNHQWKIFESSSNLQVTQTLGNLNKNYCINYEQFQKSESLDDIIKPMVQEFTDHHVEKIHIACILKKAFEEMRDWKKKKQCDSDQFSSTVLQQADSPLNHRNTTPQISHQEFERLKIKQLMFNNKY